MADPAFHPRPLPDILEEHLLELGLLCARREEIIFAPHWRLRDLGRLEERLIAHLDALAIGAASAEPLIKPLLAGEEIGPTIAATLVAMALKSPELDATVLSALDEAKAPECADGIRIGLRHCDLSRIADRLRNLVVTARPETRAAAADILSFQGLKSQARPADLFSVADARLRCIAYETAARLGGPWNADEPGVALADERPRVRRVALETSARLGMPGLAAFCRKAAARRPVAPEAVVFLGLLGNAEDLPVLDAGAAQQSDLVLATAALEGLGVMGSVLAIPRLLKAMESAPLVASAGAAFIRITGIVAIDPGDPNPAPPDLPAAREWWEREKGRFAAEGRWQLGLEIPVKTLPEHFNHLPLAIRRDVYLRLRAKAIPGAPVLELESRAARQ